MPRLAPPLALLGLLAVCARLPAADYTWANAAGGSWDAPGNWSPTGTPGAGDNVTVAVAGTYGVGLNGPRAANNVTLNRSTATVGAFSNDFTLGGTMTLTAGDWYAGSFLGYPTTFTGGTITRGAGGTGTFTVGGDLRVVNTTIQAAALRFDPNSNSVLRLSGSSNFTAGTVTFTNTMPAPDGSGILFENNATLSTNVILSRNVNLAAAGGTSLTIAAGTTVTYNDPNFNGPAVVGGHPYDENANLTATLINQGTIRAQAGELYIGRYFTTGNTPSGVAMTNQGLIDAPGFITMNLNTFTNAPGGTLRATAGGGVFLFGRFGWQNNGTFEVENGSLLQLGGQFTRASLGSIVRTGSNVIQLYAARMNNAGGTFALSAATGSYQIYGSIDALSIVTGGAISATGGAKLQVVGAGASPLDVGILQDVAVGAGVLDFSANRGQLHLRGTSTLTAGDTITLAGNGTVLGFSQTATVDGVTVVLSGANSELRVVDEHTLTLGPTTVVRKMGSTTATLGGYLLFAASGTPTLVNRGLIEVKSGTLVVPATAFTPVVNKGTVTVDNGGTWQGSLTSDGGTVRGFGVVAGPVSFAGTGNELRPGITSGTGVLTTGNVTLNGGTTFFVRLNGTAAGSEHDRLNVIGTVDLGGATLSALLGGTYTPAAGDKLFLLTNDGTDAITGTFAGLPDGAAVDVGGGYVARISYFGNQDTGLLTGGNDVVLYAFAPVPEPAAGLLAAAAAGLVIIRRGPARRGGNRAMPPSRAAPR